MQDCLFCKIIDREIPAKIIFEDNQLLAFHDIDPQAPTHILIIPKKHIATLNDLSEGNDLNEGDAALIGRLQVTAARLAQELGFADAGYRVVMNCNEHGGQTVWHVHMHLLAGRVLSWPPG